MLPMAIVILTNSNLYEMLPIRSVLYEMLPRQNVTIRKCTIQNITDPSEREPKVEPPRLPSGHYAPPCK